MANNMAIENAARDSAESALAKALARLQASRQCVSSPDFSRGLDGLAPPWWGDRFAWSSGSMPAIKAFGFNFLTSEAWNPVTEKFGAMAPIYGTVVTSLIAMIIAVPSALGIADLSD